MPVMLEKGTIIKGKKGEYVVESEKPIIGGQAHGYYIFDKATRQKLFLKMFIDVTDRERSPDAGKFKAHQLALHSKLREIQDYVCKEIEFFVHNRFFYKVLERMEGSNMGDKLKEAAKQDNPEFWPQNDRLLNAQILAYTLAEIHDHKIAHLDLKPDNCFLAKRLIAATGETKPIMRLLDFDGALIIGGPAPLSIIGSANYMSPEHVAPLAFGNPGLHSDVFTLGIMLYEMLARTYPFKSERGFITRATEHPSKIAPQIPGHIAEIIWRAMSPRPQDRPTAGEIHKTLIKRETTNDAPNEVALKGDVTHIPDHQKQDTRLVLISGKRRIRFWKNMVLERQNFSGIPGNEYVSSNQAQLFKDGRSWWIISSVDNPAYPTELNGIVLEKGNRYNLKEGDIIKIGDMRLNVAYEYES